MAHPRIAAWRGRAGLGEVGHGMAGQGKDSFELVAHPRIVLGLARHGQVGHGEARQGKDLFSIPF